MFVGKFNFSKVCSNVFSPAFRDLPPVPAQNINQNNNNNKSAVSYHHAESRYGILQSKYIKNVLKVFLFLFSKC